MHVMQYYYINYMIYKALLAGMYCYMLNCFTLSYMLLHAFTSVYTKKQVLHAHLQDPSILKSTGPADEHVSLP
jgi:hypothetical protein